MLCHALHVYFEQEDLSFWDKSNTWQRRMFLFVTCIMVLGAFEGLFLTHAFWCAPIETFWLVPPKPFSLLPSPPRKMKY